jgi:DNA polymerase-3 subunit epsilon
MSVNSQPEIVEKAIRALEASGDFKVLRRVPQLESGALATGPKVAKVIVLDTETTGLDPAIDKTIEVAMIAMCVDIENGTMVGPVQEASWLEDPGFPLEPHIVALTGLTDDMLKGQKFDETQIAAFIDGAALVIAHGAAHDRPFIEARFPQMGEFPWGCSLSQVDWGVSGYGSSKLEFLAMKVGSFYEAHRALPDCRALVYVLNQLVLPAGNTLLQHLIDRSLTPDYMIHANGAPFEAKDQLRLHGYRWNADAKLWHKLLQENDLDAECDWLHTEIYRGRPARVRLDIINAMGRFSLNPPADSVRSEWRSIGTQTFSPRTSVGGHGKYSPY